MKYYVYILKSGIDDTFYKGITNNLEKRLHEHNNGECKSTKNKIPLKCIYYEEVESRLAAREREKYFKSGIGRQWLKTKFK